MHEGSYDAVYYTRRDVRLDFLQATDHSTHCPSRETPHIGRSAGGRVRRMPSGPMKLPSTKCPRSPARWRSIPKRSVKSCVRADGLVKIETNFEGLADNYSTNRPQYPQRLLGELNGLLGDGPLLAIDVASGSGISTRAVARALGDRAQIIGVEPSEDMRQRSQYAAGGIDPLPGGERKH